MVGRNSSSASLVMKMRGQQPGSVAFWYRHAMLRISSRSNICLTWFGCERCRVTSSTTLPWPGWRSPSMRRKSSGSSNV
eukprot:14355259-Heterocapsa_arctica.AAC.1